MLTDDSRTISEPELIGPIYEAVRSSDVFAVVKNKVGVVFVKAIT